MKDKNSPWHGLEALGVEVRTVAFGGPMVVLLDKSVDACTRKFVDAVSARSCNVVYHNDPIPRLPGHVDYLRDAAKKLNIPARKVAAQKLRDANALFKIPTVADKTVGLFFDKCLSANLDEMPWIKAPITVVKRYHHISSLIYYSPTAHAPPADKSSWWRSSFRGGRPEAALTGLRKPVLLDKSGRDSYGDDRFGLYDTNGKSRCGASDVAQLRADHSFFPKALAYNLRE